MSIHHLNLETLAIELYKVNNNLSTSLMQGIFKLTNYTVPHLRYHSIRTSSHSIHKEQNSLISLAPMILHIIPENIKVNL